MPPWTSPEDDYIHSMLPNGKGPTYQDLAARWHTSALALRQRGAKGKWRHKRRLYLTRLSQKADERSQRAAQQAFARELLTAEATLTRDAITLIQVDAQADPVYTAAIALIAEKFADPVIAQGLTARELDLLMAATMKAHNQRRLIFGGATERKENQLTGKDGGPIEIQAVRERLIERLALMESRQDSYDAANPEPSLPLGQITSSPAD